MDVLMVLVDMVGLHTNIKNGLGGISALLYFWRSLGVGVYAAYYRRRSILLVASAGENSVSVVLVGVGAGVADSPLPGPAREGDPPSVRDTNCHTEPQYI